MNSSVLGAHLDPAIAFLEAHFQRIDQALPLLGVKGEAVDEDVEVALFREFRFFELDDTAVLDDPEKTLFFEERGSLLQRPGERDRNLGPNRELQECLGDGVDGVSAHGPAALEAVDRADAGEQDTQEVVDLRDCGHSGAGVFGRGLLLDGDGRGDALDQVRVGLVHPFQELAGIGGERFEVAALALSIESIKGQGRLAGAADSGDDDKLIERDVEVDVFQVVDPHAAECDSLVHKSP